MAVSARMDHASQNKIVGICFIDSGDHTRLVCIIDHN